MKREDNNGVSIPTGHNQAKPIPKQELISTEVNLKSDPEVKKTLDVSWGKLVDANDVESSGQNAIHDLIMSQLHAK